MNSDSGVVPTSVTLCDRVPGTGSVLKFATVRLLSENGVMYCNLCSNFLAIQGGTEVYGDYSPGSPPFGRWSIVLATGRTR